MSNTVNVNIAASDNGSIDKVTAKTKNLSKELTKAQTIASSLGKPATGTKAYAAAKAQTDDMFEYRQARGGRGTGAEGRDFAKQAQGLGGLVHVYATFAANLFAVSAAFTALSKAADYTNMVEGLKQLGAASGRNLSAVSKNVVELTDNAVSLAEAMQTVAQTSAAGMSNEQIERLSVVAKKTSQALGRDVGDSLNRLSRGISKIEPELLDELGIFVKIDKAATDYARTLGKTAAALTDYERRQAYAIAALEEAERKFGNIDIDANPYNQLLATFKNVAVAGGEIINLVLKPIAKFMAQSPAAMATALAAVATILLKQAIPALTQWRSNLAQSAEDAEKKAQRMSKALEEFRSRQKGLEAAEYDSEAAARRANALKLVEDNKIFRKNSAADYDIRDTNSSMEIAQKRLSDKMKETNREIEKQRTLLKGLAATQKEEISIAQAKINQLGQTNSLYAATRAEILASLEATRKANLAETQGSQDTFATKIARRRSDIAAVRAESLRLRSNTSIDTETLGVTQAFKNIGIGIQEWNDRADTVGKKIGPLRAGFIQLAGGVSILTTAIGGLISVVSIWLVVIGLVIGAFQILNSWMTTNKKETKAFSDALDLVTSNSELLVKTLDNISKKSFLDQISTESLLAKANAMREIGDAADSLVKKFDKKEKTQSGWSKFWDDASGLFNQSNFDDLRDKMKASISDTLDALGTDSKSTETKEKIAKALGLDNISDLTKDKIDKALSGNSKQRITEVSQVLKQAGTEVSNTQNNISSAIGTLGEAVKSYDNIVNSLTPQDSMSKMALDSIKGFNQLSTEIESTSDALGAFLEISRDSTKLKLFPAENAIELHKLALEAQNAQAEILKLQELANKQDKIAKAAPEYSLSRKKAESTASTARSDIKNIEDSLAKKVAPALERALQKGGEAAVDQLSIGMDMAAAKAGNTISQALISGINSPAATRKLTEYKNADIAINLKLLESQANLYLAQVENTLVMQKLTEVNKMAAEQNQVGGPLPEKSMQAYESRIKNLESAISKTASARTTGGGVNTKAITKEDVKANLDLAPAYAALSQLTAAKSTAGGQMAANRIAGEVQAMGQERDRKLKDISVERTSLGIKKSSLDNEIALSSVYNENLWIQRNQLNAEDRKLELQEYAVKLSEMERVAKYRITQGAEKSVVLEDLAREKQILTAEKQQTIEKQIEASRKDQREQAEAMLSYKKYELELSEKILGLYSMQVDQQKEAGLLTETASQELKTQAALVYERNKLDMEISSIQAKMLQEGANKEALNIEIEQKKQLYALSEQMIIAQGEYTKALTKTEDTLRSIEKSISLDKYTGTEYVDAMYQDFSNKIADLTKNAKSAADAFNTSFIGAIDDSVDKFYDMLREGTLTFESMAKQLRDSVANAFYDMAKQSIKNAWKDLLQKSGILKPSDTEVAAKKMVDLNATIAAQFPQLTKAITDLTNSKALSNAPASNDSSFKTTSVDPEISQKDYNSQDAIASKLNAEEGFADSVKTQQSTVNKQQKLVADQNNGFLTLGKAISAIPGPIGMLGQYITMFGQFIMTMQATSSVSGGGGGGILGGLANLFSSGGSKTAWSAVEGSSSFIGPMPDGAVASAASSAGWLGILAAKGGVFPGAPGLSEHSNSIVSSPTLFAYAKGGVPNYGIMGEAGPEAIIPLKRDSDGNLGIRAPSEGITNDSSNNNNITINVSAPGGDPAEVRRSTAAATRALLATLNGSRRYG